MEKYSVLMSLYHKEKQEYLKQALESMIHQTVKPDEIVVVYDGPLNASLYELMDSYIEMYPELFKIVINEKNLGLGLALNKGLLACRNDLVARMDTDDISVEDRCERQLMEFEKDPDLSVCGSIIDEFIDNKDNIIAKRKTAETDDLIKNRMRKRCEVNHVSVMLKKSSVLKSGNYKDWFWNEDYFLWIRLCFNGYKFYNIQSSLVKVRVGKDMYERRGGLKYFKSEYKLQKYMLNIRMINVRIFLVNVLKRLIGQVLIPKSLRGYVYKKFLRNG